MELNFEHSHDAAMELHQAGEHLKAFQELKRVMEYPGFMHGDGEWAKGWHLLGSIAGAMGFERLSQLAIRAGDNPHDPKLLYNLGYELIEVQLPKVAATPLNQAHLMCPTNEAILSELSTAFENAGCYDLAYMNLCSCEAVLEESYMCRYLLAFNAIMCGQLEASREAFAKLGDPPDENYAFMRDRIGMFLDRAQALESMGRLGKCDLRGWHHVLSGSVLLHLSPYGFDKPMRGRYAYRQDSVESVREGIERVRATLCTWGEKVEQVVYWTDRDSEVLARAYGELEGLPVLSWEEAGANAAGLFVAYDLSEVSPEFLQAVQDRLPGQRLWAHALQWTVDFPVAADFHTFMHQHNKAPWSETCMSFDPETGEMLVGPSKRCDVESLVEEVLEAEIEANPVDELECFLEFVQAVGPPPSEGKRSKYFHGSPVCSNRFE